MSPPANTPDPHGGWGRPGSTYTLDPVNRLDGLVFRGRRLGRDLAERVLSAKVSSSTDQITEIEVVFDDPHYTVLKSGYLALRTPVTYGNLRLQVAVVETSEVGVTARLRPVKVWKLRRRRGKLVRRNLSPTQWVRDECAAVGVTCVAQSSPKRKRVARDVVEKGQTYTPASYPSSWTTFQRLADELGYIVYEWGGTIFFGKPTWLVKHAARGAAEVTWGKSEQTDMLAAPSFRRSVDDDGVTFTVEVGLNRAEDVWPGRAIRFPGMPAFSGTYMIESVEFPLAGPGTVTVTGATPINPDPAGEAAAGGGEEGGVGTGAAVAAIARREALKSYPYDNKDGQRTVSTSDCLVDNPPALDCSDFTYRVFALALGRKPPSAFYNFSDAQLNYCRGAGGKIVSVEEAKRIPGALLARYGHVAISLGDGRQAAAHMPGVPSSISTVSGSGGFTHGCLPGFIDYG